MKQLTLKEEFVVNGKGLHTGLDIEARFKPAPENHGYKIKRTDMEGQPVIDAVAENVIGTTRGTIIGQGEAKVSTIEHALAALYATGVDNCLIEVNAPELPILDGSSIIYCENIERVGLQEQDADKIFYTIRNKIEITDEETNASIVAMPDDRLVVESMISFPSPVLSNQFAVLSDLGKFKEEVASCRTFVFLREIEPLLNQNLIKGGDLQNAVVIYDSPMSQEQLDHVADIMHSPRKQVSEFGYINEKPLMFENEPARHKIMDILGDLSLIGRPLKGRIVATKPGHGINTAFAKKIRQEIKRQDVQPPIYNPSVAPLMDVNRIRELLPHRYPFLMVDKVIEKGEKYIVGVKNVSGNEPFFQGHFPQEPVMPGVLMVEAMAQTGGLLVLSTVEDPERYSTYFMKIDNVKFRQKVVPGDTLLFHVSFMTPLRRGCAMMKGLAFVGDKVVCECEFMAQIIKNK